MAPLGSSVIRHKRRFLEAAFNVAKYGCTTEFVEEGGMAEIQPEHSLGTAKSTVCMEELLRIEKLASSLNC